jgi:hypothetical protein
MRYVVVIILIMQNNDFHYKYQESLKSLADDKKITQNQLDHFIRRGIQVISPTYDFDLKSLGKMLPKIVIGASDDYINRMKVPYQATSYIAAKTNANDDSYIYKIPGKNAGGVLLLAGGKRKLGDNAFASISRILLGYKAIMVSAVNLMVNKSQIWNWQFFGNNLKVSNLDIYEDLLKLERIKKRSKHFYYIVIARSDRTFKRVNLLEEYKKNEIAVFNPDNKIEVIFVTSQSGYDCAAKTIPESDLVNYIVTGEQFLIYEAMLTLRKKYSVDIMLNDGGRNMSNGVRDAGLLGEERVTLEPYPGTGLIPNEIDPPSVLGKKGIGLDGNEVEGTILIQSNEIGDEKANVYLYPLDEQKII